MIFEYKGKYYPDYLKDGNAISYILPVAEYFLKGKVLDIGGTQNAHFPGAECVNVLNRNGQHAMNLPDKMYDGIISSHALEHLKDPFYALKYWTEHLKKGGVMFLYLPDIAQKYWAFDAPLHLHILTPEMIEGWFEKIGYKNILKSGQDMYWSFCVLGWKK